MSVGAGVVPEVVGVDGAVPFTVSAVVGGMLLAVSAVETVPVVAEVPGSGGDAVVLALAIVPADTAAAAARPAMTAMA